ncbi:MAG: hypothetical protein ACR2F1_06830 [Nitrososphaeraceae archaeon]
MKHIVNSRINRLEYELKIAMEIEHSSKIVYQLEMLECCKVIINVDLLRRTRKEENGISPFSSIKTISNNRIIF